MRLQQFEDGQLQSLIRAVQQERHDAYVERNRIAFEDDEPKDDGVYFYTYYFGDDADWPVPLYRSSDHAVLTPERLATGSTEQLSLAIPNGSRRLRGRAVRRHTRDGDVSGPLLLSDDANLRPRRCWELVHAITLSRIVALSAGRD
jgi:hypothetical protein